MTKTFKLIILSTIFFSCNSGIPTPYEANLKYRTIPSMDVPVDVNWEGIEFAKEIINVKEKIVYYGAGTKAISQSEWNSFKVRLPWVKNIDRNILFTKTALLRSPNISPNCDGSKCFNEILYKDFSWVELAQPVALECIPSKTDTKNPDEGHLVLKVIKKCQLIFWEDEIYELSDDIGNKYVMHATENGEPNLNVVLPDGYSIQKIKIDKPLILAPFGDKGDCYFNILGDHLGQGYHQYKYSGEYFPG